jgi:hypothetical protein
VAPAVFVMCRVIPAGDHATAGRQPKETTMNILKVVLLCSLRVAIFACLKVALLAYTLFLSDTAFVSAVPERNGNVGDTASSAGPEAMH